MHAVTGMRDFSAAVADIDEEWRTIFRTGQIASQSRRQPGGVRISDVSVAEADDSGSSAVCTASEIAAMGCSCWNCRGLGHMREFCPSPVGLRAMGLVIDQLRSTLTPFGKGKGKGASKGKRAAATRLRAVGVRWLDAAVVLRLRTPRTECSTLRRHLRCLPRRRHLGGRARRW